MNQILQSTVKQICEAHGNDRGRMMDIVQAVQQQLGCVDGQAMDMIAAQCTIHRV